MVTLAEVMQWVLTLAGLALLGVAVRRGRHAGRVGLQREHARAANMHRQAAALAFAGALCSAASLLLRLAVWLLT